MATLIEHGPHHGAMMVRRDDGPHGGDGPHGMAAWRSSRRHRDD